MFDALPLQINNYQNISKTNRQNILQYILNTPRDNKMCSYGQDNMSTKPDARHDHIQRTFLGNAETAWDINRLRSLAGQKEIDSPTGSHAFVDLFFQVRPNYLL